MGKQRTCFCCGKAYHYCPVCDGDKNKPSWYFIFDSDNCRKIFDTCQRFSTKEYTADEARAKLDKCDLTDKTNLLPDIQNVIKKVFAETNKTAQSPSSSPAPSTKKERRRVGGSLSEKK